MTWKRKSNIDCVEIVEVIRVDSIIGQGVTGDPVRRLVEFWSMDGKLLARDDSLDVDDLPDDREGDYE